MSSQEHLYAGLVLVTGPSTEPVSLAAVKDHLHLTPSFTAEDGYITEMITTARRECEATMRRVFLTQTWRLALKNWPGRSYRHGSTATDFGCHDHIKLPFPPLQSVTTLNYYDSGGVQHTMPQGATIGASSSGNAALANSYNVFTDFEPGRIALAFSQVWPTEILLPGAPVQITYVVGYPDVATFYASFEGASAVARAIKMMAGYWYENRIPPSEMRKSSISAALNFVVDELLTPYRVRD